MAKTKFNYKIFLFIFSFLIAGNCLNVSAYGEDNVKNSLKAKNKISAERKIVGSSVTKSKKAQQSVKENTFAVTGTELQPKSNVYAVTGTEKQKKVKPAKQTDFVVTGNELQPKSNIYAVTGTEKQGKVKSKKQTNFDVTGGTNGTEYQDNNESVVYMMGTENKNGKQTKLADSSQSVNVADPSAVSSVNKKQNKKGSEEKETINIDNTVLTADKKESSKEGKDRRYIAFCSGNFFHFYGYEEEDKDKMDMEEYFKKLKETSKTGKTFELTGNEIGKKKETEFFLTGKEFDKKSFAAKQKTEELTDYQKAKLEYILMEEKSKLFGLRRMLEVAKKLLYSELSKENYNLAIIANLKQEILSTASDIELVKFETECKIRGLLSLEQYKKLEKKIKKRRNL